MGFGRKYLIKGEQWMECSKKMHTQKTKLRTEAAVCGGCGGDRSRRRINGIQGKIKPVQKNKIKSRKLRLFRISKAKPLIHSEEMIAKSINVITFMVIS